MQIEYTKYGDYLLPNLTINERKDYNGLILLNSLKTNKNGLYQELLIKDKLTDYLIDMDKYMSNRINHLTRILAEKENINEKIKEKDQLRWVGLMNNYKNIAEEMWDDYEVVVATHQNTNHIHNHFIINSVSYKTGKKYNNNKSTYARLRNISDSLCQEYGLSTLEEETRYKNSYKNKWEDNDYYRIAKEDIDTIISESISSKQFLAKLKQLGYKYYIKYDKLTIYKENQDKIRIEKIFGNNYSLDRLNERISKFMYKYYKPMSQKSIYQQYLLKTQSKHKGIYGLYLYYCYLLKVFLEEHQKRNLPSTIRADIKKLDQITEETRFMVDNKIETLEELLSFKEHNSIKQTELASKRAI